MKINLSNWLVGTALWFFPSKREIVQRRWRLFVLFVGLTIGFLTGWSACELHWKQAMERKEPEPEEPPIMETYPEQVDTQPGGCGTVVLTEKGTIYIKDAIDCKAGMWRKK